MEPKLNDGTLNDEAANDADAIDDDDEEGATSVGGVSPIVDEEGAEAKESAAIEPPKGRA